MATVTLPKLQVGNKEPFSCQPGIGNATYLTVAHTLRYGFCPEQTIANLGAPHASASSCVRHFNKVYSKCGVEFTTGTIMIGKDSQPAILVNGGKPVLPNLDLSKMGANMVMALKAIPLTKAVVSATKKTTTTAKATVPEKATPKKPVKKTKTQKKARVAEIQGNISKVLGDQSKSVEEQTADLPS